MPDETIEKIDKRKGKGKYWYFITVEECVMGDSEHVYRERRYTPKPENHAERYDYIQFMCSSHYFG